MRTTWLLLTLPVLLLPLVSACSSDGDPKAAENSGDTASDIPGGDDDTADAPVPTWHADIAPIFAHSCDGCHTDGGIGTPQWNSPEEAAQWAIPIAAAVGARTMPPWRASSDCNTYVGDFSLSDDQIAAVLAWAEGDAPLGDPATAESLPQPYTPPSLDRVDLELRMPVAYEPAPIDGGADDYRCFLMEWPYEETVWVTGYEMRPDNLQAVHHIIPYIIAPGDVAQYQAIDDADPEPGYTCYGGPGGSTETLINTRWLGSWAPGSAPGIFEDGVGLEVPPGGMVAFQVHYNVTEAGHTDQSGIALRVETEPQGWAEIQPWTDVSWLFGTGMDIPANTDSVTHSWSHPHGNTFTLRTAGLHMHTLGKSAKLWIERADGTEECLLQIDNYDFNWQRSYELEVPVQTVPGDTINLSCTWDNPTDQDAAWGDGTGDEMCLGITLITR